MLHWGHGHRSSTRKAAESPRTNRLTKALASCHSTVAWHSMGLSWCQNLDLVNSCRWFSHHEISPVKVLEIFQRGTFQPCSFQLFQPVFVGVPKVIQPPLHHKSSLSVGSGSATISAPWGTMIPPRARPAAICRNSGSQLSWKSH